MKNIDLNDVRSILELKNIYIKEFNFERTEPDFYDKFGVKYVYDDKLLLCLAYTLDAAGFTDHGSSISGAWLTDEGKMFLWLLEQNRNIYEGDDCNDRT